MRGRELTSAKKRVVIACALVAIIVLYGVGGLVTHNGRVLAIAGILLLIVLGVIALCMVMLRFPYRFNSKRLPASPEGRNAPFLPSSAEGRRAGLPSVTLDELLVSLSDYPLPDATFAADLAAHFPEASSFK